MALNTHWLNEEESGEEGGRPAGGRIVRLRIGGSESFGMLLLPHGAGPHPLVIMYHGLPGSLRNEDWAQALRRAGMAVFLFSYRGSWGSGGDWSYQHCLEDAHTVCALFQEPMFAASYAIDPTRIVLMGHSFGGLLAVLTAGVYGVRDLVLISPADAAKQWLEANAGPESRARRMRQLEQICLPLGEHVRAEQLWKDMGEQLEHFDLLAALPRLPEEASILLIGAQYDTWIPAERYLEPLTEALRARFGERIRTLTLPTGHNYNTHRLELAGAVVDWLASLGY